MFWARRKPERTSHTNQHAQSTVTESQETSIINKDEKIYREGHADSSAEKYSAALNRLEKKVLYNKGKYNGALSKLERKVQLHKIFENGVSSSADASSFPDRSPVHGPRGPPSLKAVSVLENIKERTAPSKSPLNQVSCHERDLRSETKSMCLKMGVSHSPNTLSGQDLLSVNCAAAEKNRIHSERKSVEGEPCSDASGVGQKEVCSDESSNDSNNQRLEESVFLSERINSDLIKVYRCTFCSTYYLQYKSYQNHKKNCLTCPKCYLTFSSIIELYKHVTSKAHKEYFSFLEVCQWTQSQLRLYISRNEVYESNVEKSASLESDNQKEPSASVTDSSIGQSLSSGDEKQDVGTRSLPSVSACPDPAYSVSACPDPATSVSACPDPATSVSACPDPATSVSACPNPATSVSACPDSATSTQENNESLSASQSMVGKKMLSKHGEEIGSPACNKETGKPKEENNNETVCMKKTKNGDGPDRPSDRKTVTNTSRSVAEEPRTGDTQQNKHFAQSRSQKGKSNKKVKEKQSTHKKAYPEKNFNREASKSKNVLSKTSQKIAKDCKSPQNKKSRTTEKAASGSEPENNCLKIEPLPRDKSSMQTDNGIVTSKSHIKKEKESLDRIPKKQQSNNKKLHRKQSSSRPLESKNACKDLSQGAEGSKSGKASPRKTQVSSAGSKPCHRTDSRINSSSSGEENSNSNNAVPSTIQTNHNQESGKSEKQRSVVTSGQTKKTLKRSHSFEESAPKSRKILMKVVGTSSDSVLSSRKIDVIPEDCPLCSNTIDFSACVFNTKTNHMSVWCQTCKGNIVFSPNA